MEQISGAAGQPERALPGMLQRLFPFTVIKPPKSRPRSAKLHNSRLLTGRHKKARQWLPGARK
jgi:hypothetical protein